MDDLDDIRRRIDDLDSQMAALFERRMLECRRVARLKKLGSLPIEDAAREEQLLERNSARVADRRIRAYCTRFWRSVIELSKEYQHSLIGGE